MYITMCEGKQCSEKNITATGGIYGNGMGMPKEGKQMWEHKLYKIMKWTIFIRSNTLLWNKEFFWTATKPNLNFFFRAFNNLPVSEMCLCVFPLFYFNFLPHKTLTQMCNVFNIICCLECVKLSYHKGYNIPQLKKLLSWFKGKAPSECEIQNNFSLHSYTYIDTVTNLSDT